MQLYCTSSCAHSDVDPGQVLAWRVLLSGAQTVAELSRRVTTCEPPALSLQSSAASSALFRCFVLHQSDIVRSQTAFLSFFFFFSGNVYVVVNY